jgi:carbon monoxide dehydrogenase subunit G
VTVTYRGNARFTDVDEQQYAATIEAGGKETRRSGTADATVLSMLSDKGGETEVRMVTELAITGKPAQFGRGTLADVGEKLVSIFADCLSEELAQ